MGEPTAVGTMAARTAVPFLLRKATQALGDDPFVDACRKACVKAFHETVEQLRPGLGTGLDPVFEQCLSSDTVVMELLDPLRKPMPLAAAEDALRARVRELMDRFDVDLDPFDVAPDAVAAGFSCALQNALHEQAAQGHPVGHWAVLLGIARLHADTTAASNPRRRMAQFYIDPTTLFEDLRVEELAGRQWLLEQVDAFIAREDSGYIVIEANAGLGKSTFLGYLAQVHGFAAHFTRLVERPSDAGVACGNLAAQLSTRYDLPAVEAVELADRAVREVEALGRLLRLTAEARPDDSPLIVLIDGIDEVDRPPDGRNPLNLPKRLPRGCYVIAAQRPEAPRIWTTSPQVRLTIDPDGETNLDDMRLHLARCAQEPVIASLLNASGISEKAFIDMLANRSSGIWIYLHYVLAEIRAGERTPLSLDSLPHGLRGYYSQYWDAWRARDEDNWLRWQRHVLAALALAREPLSAETLARFAGTGEPPQLRALVAGPWRPFITQASGDRFELYHLSLREYVLDPGQRMSMAVLDHELNEALEITRSNIAAILEAQVFPLLQGADLETDEVDSLTSYALDHLVPSLIDASDLGLACETVLTPGISSDSPLRWPMLKKARSGMAGFLHDVDVIFSAAAEGPQAFGPKIDIATLSLVRLALAASCVHTAALQRPLEFVIAALRCGVWTPRRALYEAVWNENRAGLETLCGLAPFLPEPARTFSLRRVLAIEAGQAGPAQEWSYPNDATAQPLAPAEERRALAVCLSTVAGVGSLRPMMFARLLRRALDVGASDLSVRDAVFTATGPLERHTRLEICLAFAIAFVEMPELQADLIDIAQGDEPAPELTAILADPPVRVISALRSFVETEEPVAYTTALLLELGVRTGDDEGVARCVATLIGVFAPYPQLVAAVARVDPEIATDMVGDLFRDASTDGLVDLVDVLPAAAAARVIDQYEEAFAHEQLGATVLLESELYDICSAAAYLAQGASPDTQKAASRLRDLAPGELFDGFPAFDFVYAGWSALAEVRDEMLSASGVRLVHLVERAGVRLDDAAAAEVLDHCLTVLPSEQYLHCCVALASRVSTFPLEHIVDQMDVIGLVGDRAAVMAAFAMHRVNEDERARLFQAAVRYLRDEEQPHLRFEVLPILIAAAPADAQAALLADWLHLAESVGRDERTAFHYVRLLRDRLTAKQTMSIVEVLRRLPETMASHEALCDIGARQFSMSEVWEQLLRHLELVWLQKPECGATEWLDEAGMYALCTQLLPIASQGLEPFLAALVGLAPAVRKCLPTSAQDDLVKAVMSFPALAW